MSSPVEREKKLKRALSWDSRLRRASEGLEALKAGRRRAGAGGHFPPSTPRRGPRLAGLLPFRDEVADEVGVARQVDLRLPREVDRVRPPIPLDLELDKLGSHARVVDHGRRVLLAHVIAAEEKTVFLTTCAAKQLAAKSQALATALALACPPAHRVR
ncbi:hypothetical protein T492DRAFT_835596 [Pavlovales sp. CCMP2436]|nr:hypothetical protein T492DRAFT_835596 [Pavlovales sp. CCMP2436]